MTRVFSYIRFSSVKQEEGDSLRRQTSLTKEWAERNGYELDENLTLRDLGISAFSGKNLDAQSALGGFIQAVNLGKVPKGSILAIERLDRLSRQDVDTAYNLWRNILKAGIKIATVANGMVYDESSLQNIGQLFVALVEFSVSNQESQKKSDRIKEVWAHKRKNVESKKLTSWCPAWLKLSKDKTEFLPIEEMVPTVVKIFEMYAAGNGVIQIARHLNDINAPLVIRHTKRMRITNWQVSTVQHILWNKAVIGHLQPKKREDRKAVAVGENITDYYPAIITEELFFKCQARMDANPQRKGKPVVGRRHNLFTGKLICGYCGKRIEAFYAKSKRSKDAVRTLKCVNSTVGQCHPFGWRLEDFEAEFIGFCAQIKKQLQQENSDATISDKIATVKKTIEDGKGRLKRYYDIIEGGEVAPAGMLKRMRLIEDEIKYGEIELEKLESKLAIKNVASPIDDITINVKLEEDEGRERVARAINVLFEKIDLFFVGTPSYAEKVNADAEQMEKAGIKRAGRVAMDFRSKWKVEDSRFFVASSRDGKWTYPRITVVEKEVNEESKEVASKYPQSNISSKEQIVEEIKKGVPLTEIAKKYSLSMATVKNIARMHK